MAATLKNLVSKNLTDKQKYILRNWVNFRFLSPPLSKSLVLILGCQRSGTTLTLLMLQAHPQIQGYDESHSHCQSPFPFPHSASLFYHNLRKTLVCFKLPGHVFQLNYFLQYFPHTKIVWPVRHPYSTISSMRLLENAEGSWINRCAKQELKGIIPLFPEIETLNVDSLDDVSLGAYVWKYKNMAISLFKDRGLNVFDFRYEDLLENPRQTMAKLLEFLELDWSEDVLNFEKSQSASKGYAGKTRGDQPLNKSRKAPNLNLAEEDTQKINSICYELMKVYQY